MAKGKKKDPLDFGPFEVLGDGAQVFGTDSGIVADCRCQWADDDDEAGGEADYARSEAMANLICSLLNKHFGHKEE